MSELERPAIPAGVVSFQGEHTAIRGALQLSKTLLENLANRLNKNEAEVDERTIIRWKAEIVEMVRAVCIAQYKEQQFDTILRETLSSCMDNDISKILALDDDEFTEQTLTKLENRASTHDPFLTDKVAKDMIKAFTKRSNDDEDLFVEEDSGLTESKIKCPVSFAIYKNPLKNNHPQKPCIHHLDETSLKSIIRGKQKIQCPVAGCSGEWMEKYSDVDDDFKMKIERFLRMKKRNVDGYSHATANAVDLEDD
jgi:hypothetical protein